jgi:hypothetical protein
MPRITVHIAESGRSPGREPPAGELSTFHFFVQKADGQSKPFKPKKLVLNDIEKSLTVWGKTGSIQQKLAPEVYEAVKERIKEQVEYIYEIKG